MPKPLIILVGGATGAGTSRIGGKILPRTRIKLLLPTDHARENIRSIVKETFIRCTSKSTYNAGIRLNYSHLSEEEQRRAVIEGYQIQAMDVQYAYDASIARALIENTPMVVEGVHIIPRDFSKHENGLIRKYNNQIMQIVVDVADPEEHKRRFKLREDFAPERKAKQYLDYFKEIRWIREYIINEAKKYNGVLIADNSKDIDHTIDQIMFEYYKRSLDR